ncbi:MAG: hypothetical protein ACRD3D_07180 [Terriglobia bacterium]
MKHVALAVAPFLLLCALPAAARQRNHLMGESPCAWPKVILGADGELDTSATISRLRSNGLNCTVQVIDRDSKGETWADFEHLLAAADSAEISVWALLLPPSENLSLPYGGNFRRWMQALARLSLKHRSLAGVNVDDLLSSQADRNLFTRDYLCSLYRAKNGVNPRFAFVPTIYDLDLPVADRLAGCVDGIWLFYTNLEQDANLRAFLDDSRLAARGRFPIFGGVYAGSTSWHREGPPASRVLDGALALACGHSDGAVVWELPLTAEPNPAIETIKRYVGKCGEVK